MQELRRPSVIGDVLYHATYEPHLASILEHGLGGIDTEKNWEDSEPGVIYLAHDALVAQSHAEASELVDEAWLDQVVVLEVDASNLDLAQLWADRNVLDDDSTLEYHGIIEPSVLRVADPRLAFHP